jgi:hypothetical protein
VYSGLGRQERSFCESERLARGRVGWVRHLFAGRFDVGVEFQRMLDKAAIRLSFSRQNAITSRRS